MPRSQTDSADYAINLSAAPYRVKIDSANFSGSTTLTIIGSGLVTNGGTVVLSSGGSTRTITVASPILRATIQLTRPPVQPAASRSPRCPSPSG